MSGFMRQENVGPRRSPVDMPLCQLGKNPFTHRVLDVETGANKWTRDITAGSLDADRRSIKKLATSVAAGPGPVYWVSGGIDDDHGFHRIRKYSASGKLLVTIDSQEESVSLAVDSDGNLFVAAYRASNPDHSTLTKYDPDGVQLWQAVFGQGIYTVKADNEGNVYLVKSEAGGNSLVKYDPDGGEIWTFALSLSDSISFHSVDAETGLSAVGRKVIDSGGSLVHTFGNVVLALGGGRAWVRSGDGFSTPVYDSSTWSLLHTVAGPHNAGVGLSDGSAILNIDEGTPRTRRFLADYSVAWTTLLGHRSPAEIPVSRMAVYGDRAILGGQGCASVRA